MGEAILLLHLFKVYIEFYYSGFYPFPTLTFKLYNMPTIVTEIVNNMFRSQRNQRAFAKKLSELPASTSDSEAEDSDAETLDSSLNASRDFVQLAANQPREDYFLWGTELSRSKDVFVLKLDEDINEDEERHLLLLKNFCLGLNAIEGLQASATLLRFTRPTSAIRSNAILLLRLLLDKKTSPMSIFA